MLNVSVQDIKEIMCDGALCMLAKIQRKYLFGVTVTLANSAAFYVLKPNQTYSCLVIIALTSTVAWSFTETAYAIASKRVAEINQESNKALQNSSSIENIEMINDQFLAKLT